MTPATHVSNSLELILQLGSAGAVLFSIILFTLVILKITKWFIQELDTMRTSFYVETQKIREEVAAERGVWDKVMTRALKSVNRMSAQCNKIESDKKRGLGNAG